MIGVTMLTIIVATLCLSMYIFALIEMVQSIRHDSFDKGINIIAFVIMTIAILLGILARRRREGTARADAARGRDRPLAARLRRPHHAGARRAHHGGADRAAPGRDRGTRGAAGARGGEPPAGGDPRDQLAVRQRHI